MKRFFKILGYSLGSILLILILLFSIVYIRKNQAYKRNVDLLGPEAPTLTIQGTSFRDLNKNGEQDPYENAGLTVDERVDDLIQQMTLEEKAGLLFITMIGMTKNGKTVETPPLSDPMNLMFSFILPSGSEMIAKKKMNNFNIINSFDLETMARFNNTIQKMAERTRLGIPVTIASDPRHGVSGDNVGISISTPGFSEWPGPLGLAASRDTNLVRTFAEIARQEYMAAGIRMALHPMADLATEPRWGRVSGTFGEDADLVSKMVKAYVLGFQGDTLSSSSVACMTKHYPGGGTNPDGHETHFAYGKDQAYSGNNFAYQLSPYLNGAFPAHTAAIMPSYGIPKGIGVEEVAFGFNREMIQKLLRDSLGFDGVVCTDWNIITDSRMGKMVKGGASAWGVESLSPKERMKKVLDAGCDQFGGETETELIIELVNEGAIREERIDQSVRRILRDKFTLGLFDDPYVDVETASNTAQNDSYKAKGVEAQQKSIVLLKNDEILPLKNGTKIWSPHLKTNRAISEYGTLVKKREEADVVVLMVNTPFDPKSDYLIERFLHQGRLHFNDEEIFSIRQQAEGKPLILIINLDRPAILTQVEPHTRAILAQFGASDEVISQILFGIVNPNGKLPFELPSSPEAVEAQLEDVPYDSNDPLYPFGYGLSYTEKIPEQNSKLH